MFSLYILKEYESTQELLDTITINQPCIIIKENGKIIQAVLVEEREIICTFEPKEAGPVLLSAFYAFNMYYTEGCSNFYSA